MAVLIPTTNAMILMASVISKRTENRKSLKIQLRNQQIAECYSRILSGFNYNLHDFLCEHNRTV